MTAKEITLDYIRSFCKENEERKAWYNAETAKTYACAVFPKGADGKADRTQAPTTEMRQITFIQLKQAFIARYYPELAPQKKPKKENMYTPL